MNDKVHTIREQFPDQDNTIDLLMAEDPEFLAMYEDYDACLNALQYWVKSQEPEAKDRVNEYRALIRELQQEISEALVAVELRRRD
jgi:hypothetical protein